MLNKAIFTQFGKIHEFRVSLSYILQHPDRNIYYHKKITKSTKYDITLYKKSNKFYLMRC